MRQRAGLQLRIALEDGTIYALSLYGRVRRVAGAPSDKRAGENIWTSLACSCGDGTMAMAMHHSRDLVIVNSGGDSVENSDVDGDSGISRYRFKDRICRVSNVIDTGNGTIAVAVSVHSRGLRLLILDTHRHLPDDPVAPPRAQSPWLRYHETACVKSLQLRRSGRGSEYIVISTDAEGKRCLWQINL